MRNQNLPAGVNDRDLEFFTKSQEAAKDFLARENSRLTGASPGNLGCGSPIKSEGAAHGVPSQVAVPHLSSSSPGSTARYVKKEPAQFILSGTDCRQIIVHIDENIYSKFVYITGPLWQFNLVNTKSQPGIHLHILKNMPG